MAGLIKETVEKQVFEMPQLEGVIGGLDGRSCIGCVQEHALDLLAQSEREYTIGTFDQQLKSDFPDYQPSTNKDRISHYHSEPGTS
jgi:hypothetical protein